MIYFYKDLTKQLPSQLIDFKQYYDRFDFLELIHPDKNEEITHLVKDNPILLADIAASVVSKFRNSDYLNLKRVTIKGLYCCQDLMSNKGYELTYLSKLFNEQISLEKECHVLVAGCQSRRTQRSRVGALIRFVCSESCKYKIVFSGKNPGTEYVRTCNEAVEMERIFQNGMDKIRPNDGHDDDNYSTFKYELDEKATDTITNIERYLNTLDENTNIDSIVIISSTFHLLRLSDALEKILLESSLKDKITKVVLIGSEDPEDPDLETIHEKYIKWMYFDIFNNLFKEYR